MQICPNCGEENPARFRLCGFCGAALAAALPPQEERKTVTIVFSDLMGSTSLGEKLDPESLREVMTRYFDAMTAVLRHHGGTIEKFIGDAIMAVFGLPKLHEDDALRAVRAALGMQRALAELNLELDLTYGVELANRTGVNTGEVVTGDAASGQRLVTGDAVNVAARLEQAAPRNQVLLGDLTYRLVRGAVTIEAVEPLELKGKSARVPAYQLLGVAAVSEGFVRRRDAPMIGRDSELAALAAMYDAAVSERGCRSSTVIGDAGVGKSRLVSEFTHGVEGVATVLRGRCLPYGEGITFWPLVEAARSAASIEADDPPELALQKLANLTTDHRVVARVASAIGLSNEPFGVPEIFWAARRLLEELAETRPVVLVVDDIHWAEATFLELLTHLVEFGERSIFLLLTARHDLLEAHPTWGEGVNLDRLELSPLSEADTAKVAEALLGNVGLATDAKARIVRAAEGNPLFVEQLLSMLIDTGVLRQGGEGWETADPAAEFPIPPTIQALLSARLDQLRREERAVIEPASVIGLEFAREAATALAPEAVRPAVGTHLAAMTRKQLMRPGAADSSGETYRFNHILIRDAAYGGLLKRARATFHERFVAWADAVNAERDRAGEHEEILGYHLEQAYRYLAQLGPLDEHGRELGRRAAERLAAAGRRAAARGDIPAAANLLRRAAATLQALDAERLALLVDLGESLTELGEFGEARRVLDEALETSEAIDDQRLASHARLVGMYLHLYAADVGDWTARVAEEVDRSIPIFSASGDESGLAKAFRLRFLLYSTLGQYGQAAEAAERISEHAALAGDPRQQRRGASNYAQVALHGPVPALAAIARSEALMAEISGDRSSEAIIRGSLARLYAMRGEFERARVEYQLSRSYLEELGQSVYAASTSLDSAPVELLAGDADAAEASLRRDYAELGDIGERYVLSTVAGLLSDVLFRRGAFEDADAFSLICQELAAPDDVASQALWRSTRAKLLAHAQQADAAIELASGTVELVRATEAPLMQAEALTDLAEILVASGRQPQARPALSEALQLYEAKGDLVSAGRVRLLLDNLSFSPAGTAP